MDSVNIYNHCVSESTTQPEIRRDMCLGFVQTGRWQCVVGLLKYILWKKDVVDARTALKVGIMLHETGLVVAMAKLAKHLGGTGSTLASVIRAASHTDALLMHAVLTLCKASYWRVAAEVVLHNPSPNITAAGLSYCRAQIAGYLRRDWEVALRVLHSSEGKVGPEEAHTYAMIQCLRGKWREGLQVLATSAILSPHAFEHQCVWEVTKRVPHWESLVGILSREVGQCRDRLLVSKMATVALSRMLHKKGSKDVARRIVTALTTAHVPLEAESILTCLIIDARTLLPAASFLPFQEVSHALSRVVYRREMPAWDTVLELLTRVKGGSSSFARALAHDPRLDCLVVLLMRQYQPALALHAVKLIWPQVPDISRAPQNLLSHRADAVFVLASHGMTLAAREVVKGNISKLCITSVLQSAYWEVGAGTRVKESGVVPVLLEALQYRLPLSLPLAMASIVFAKLHGWTSTAWEIGLFVLRNPPFELSFEAHALQYALSMARAIHGMTKGVVSTWLESLAILRRSPRADDAHVSLFCAVLRLDHATQGALWLAQRLDLTPQDTTELGKLQARDVCTEFTQKTVR